MFLLGTTQRILDTLAEQHRATLQQRSQGKTVKAYIRASWRTLETVFWMRCKTEKILPRLSKRLRRWRKKYFRKVLL